MDLLKSYTVNFIGWSDMLGFEQATIRDFLQIAELDRNSWQDNRNFEFIPDGEHVWRLWVEHGLVYTAKQEVDVVGAIVAFPGKSGIWCLHKVFVAPEHRGQGVAMQLLGYLLQALDEIGADCFLTVDPENDSALNLYEKLGFSEKKYIKGYYRPYEDRLVLTRRTST